LRAGKYIFIEGEALVTSAPDQPGAVAGIARRLADAGVNLQGLAILGWHQGKAELALSVDDPDMARRAARGAHTGCVRDLRPPRSAHYQADEQFLTSLR